jgi:long-chain acyl-CoA synthetase
VWHGTRAWASHAQRAARSAALAPRLRAAGLAPGDRVVPFMRKHPRTLEILWAAWWAGLAVVPVNAKLHPAEVEWIIDHAQALRLRRRAAQEPRRQAAEDRAAGPPSGNHAAG